MSPIRTRRRCAFTLIELLIVLGIIAVLLGIVLTAVGRARAASSQIVCAANLREWATAVQFHVIANHGYLPRRGQGVQPTNLVARPQDWFNALPPLLKLKPFNELVAANAVPRPGGGSHSIWVCPSARAFDGTYYWSYGMNMALSVEQANQNNGQPDKITGVGGTSTMVFMADGPGNYGAVIPSKFPGGYNPVARHLGRTNVAFLDGHVAAYRADEIGIGTGLIDRADVRWHPPNSTWTNGE